MQSPIAASSFAQTLAGRAVLLEIGAKLGVLDPLISDREFSVESIARDSGVSEAFLSAYYCALSHAGLVRQSVSNDGPCYVPASDFQQSLNEVGYILWAMASCAPLVENAPAFSKDLAGAVQAFQRNGEHVARTSKWMGEHDFYPHAERSILAAQPRKIVDLGSGTCGLLIRCLRKLPEAVGVGVDINPDACVKARSIVERAGLSSRLSVVEASVQSLVDQPGVLKGAEVIHAGFVFHDLMPDEEDTLDALLARFRRTAPQSALIITDAVPYAQDPSENAFSAAFTFLHSHFMGRQLLSEAEWTEKLRRAGYGSIDIQRLGISGGRVFTAKTVA